MCCFTVRDAHAMAGFGAEIWVIGAPVSIFVVKNLIEGVVAYLRKVDREVTLIDALSSELSLIKSGAMVYATQLRAGRSTIKKTAPQTESERRSSQGRSSGPDRRV